MWGQTCGNLAPDHLPAAHCHALDSRGEPADVVAGHTVVDEGEQLAGHSDGGGVAAPAEVIAARVRTSNAAVTGIFCAVPTAQRTIVQPYLAIGPPRTVVSDARCRGVSPAQELKCRGLGKQCTSPISVVKIAAWLGLTPGTAWTAR